MVSSSRVRIFVLPFCLSSAVLRSSTARRGAESVQRAADPTRRRDKTVEATGNREGGRRRPRSVPLTQAVFGPASSGFTVALTTARGEGWDAVRREVRGETGGSARREAIARLGEYREIGTTTRGDAATRGERRCRAPWTVIVPEGMTPSGVPRSSEGEMRDEPGARVRLRRPRGPRAAVVVGLALGACMSFFVGRTNRRRRVNFVVRLCATRPFV